MISSWLKKPYQWMGSTTHSPYADYILCFLFYIEAIFFLPTDPILIVFCIERQDRALSYAMIALIGSVLGGLSSYMIGAFLWDMYGKIIIHHPLVNYIMTPARFYTLAEAYEKNQWFAICVAGFTPIPYKAATLAAGFCKLSLVPFVLSSIVARGARFYLIALGCKIWGEQIKDSVQKYFNVILLFTVVLVILTVWLFT